MPFPPTPTVLLPNHPTLLVDDRFDILCLPSPSPSPVSFWSIIQTLLSHQQPHSITALIDLIDSLSLTLHGTARSKNFDLLKRVFKTHFPDGAARDRFWEKVWPRCRDLALSLPDWFPGGEISALAAQEARKSVRLERREVACLVVHQFLCTIPKPSWMTDGCQDFSVWYASPTPHEGAVEGYLRALFRYFEVLVELDIEPSRPQSGNKDCIVFTLRSLGGKVEMLLKEDVPLRPLEVLSNNAVSWNDVEKQAQLLGLPGGASVISANKDVGFGPSGSQEEMVVGSSPELCPVVLLAPTLQENEVIVVQGARALVTLGGYARTARFAGFVESSRFEWARRTVLFMDALELDSYDSQTLVPDLLDGNVERELIKAYTAFSATKRSGAPFDSIVTGMWGCRSFGGNRYVKTLIQWIAASLAGCTMRFVCNDAIQEAFGRELVDFMAVVLGKNVGASALLGLLHSVRPEDHYAKSVFHIIEKIVND